MMTVIIATRNSARHLAPCLAALVNAAAAGVVRDVVVADGDSRDSTLELAEDAGCDILSGPHDLGTRLARAAAVARANWLLFLVPGCVLEDGWAGAAEGFVDRTERGDGTERAAAAFRYALEADGARARLAESVVAARRLVRGRVRPEQGLLIHRRLYQRAGGHQPGSRADFALLARLGRRIGLLRARAFVPDSF